ncbi:UDP-glucose 4-epimerase GalE [Brucella intermedia]|uniref:UDP-glucose 4-epimerase GalE n=1 Tax=Brucella intermedia TaxID=94625 RepID=UPI00209B343A|nr:UDP-glucose 4-epimerase GalE [Brucella intermedia]MCO7737903.1 UDP-glucose 4-epimerase GalE [Brucella intermedia]WLF97639.1 UDP-glucose 4-epimerase GalE [Brucella intermedia]
MTILVTGGAGYIGSHTCVQLIEAGHDVVVVDNFDNSHPEALHRIEQITGRTPRREAGDIRDRAFLEQVIRHHKCTAVIHFAGLKAVGESSEKPMLYYDCNVVGTLRLLQAMEATGVKTLVFSSSATVYGDPQKLPITEDQPLTATNPYGRTKLVIEDMLRDIYNGDSSWKIAILRYFNPVGAHESGLIGEDPKGIPNNLMPIIAQVATGRREKLNVWGNDYPTPDGTGVRDYIHVVDLAAGHLKALKKLDEPQCFSVNLGTGQGYSVLDVVKAFEHVSNREIKYEIAPRRPGDVAECYADPTFARDFLGWSAEKNLREMCQDMWHWQSKNPNGYE